MRSLASASCLALATSLAAGPAAAVDWSLDLFGTPEARVELEDRSGAEPSSFNAPEPDGYGARLTFWPGTGSLFYSAEFSRLDSKTREFDVSGTSVRIGGTLEQMRLGIGFVNQTAFYTRAEAIRTEDTLNVTVGGAGSNSSRFAVGYGVHVGLAGALYPRLLLSAEVGYIDLSAFSSDDSPEYGSGLQATARAEVPVFDFLQVFTEYRYQKPSHDDSDLRIELGEWRVGLRFNF